MNYFQKRVLNEQEALFSQRATLTEIELGKQYSKTLKRIQREMKILYNEIKNDRITSVSQLYAYNRYYEMVNFLNEELTKLGAQEISIITPQFERLYRDNFKMIGDQFSLASVPNKAMVNDVINKIWLPDGLLWSDRVWNSTTALREELIQGLVDCCASGRSAAELAGVIAGKFGTSYSNASRLVRTEMSHIQNSSTLNRYIEAGVEYYEVECANDERTCKACKALKGRQFRVEDADAGTNFPPLHPQDRCCVIPVLPNMIKMKTKYRGQAETPRGITNSSEE